MILDFYQKLLDKGLPVLEADDSGYAKFSRELTELERDNYEDIVSPNLKNARDRFRAAHAIAKNIPNWSTWSQTDWQTYFDANLSDAQVDLVDTLPKARTMMKRQNLVIQNLVKLIIELRNQTWPDLPDP